MTMCGGLPVHVISGNKRWSLNLSSLEYSGEEQILPSVWYAYDSSGSTYIVDGLACPPGDRLRLERALKLVTSVDRHGPKSDAARAEAGKIIMTMRDVMVRVRSLIALDAWSGVLGALVDESPKGKLYESAIDEEKRYRLLVVKCPSTGRTYVHPVPSSYDKASEARLWMMNLDKDPEVET